MIGRSKINEILPDMTQNGCCYMLVYRQKKKRYKKHVILIRLGKEEICIKSLISHCWKSQI